MTEETHVTLAGDPFAARSGIGEVEIAPDMAALPPEVRADIYFAAADVYEAQGRQQEALVAERRAAYLARGGHLQN